MQERAGGPTGAGRFGARARGAASGRRHVHYLPRVEAGGRRGAHPAPRYSRSDVERRRRLARRGLPALGLLVVLALVLGLVLGGGPGAAERATVRRFATAWAQGDYARTYALLDAHAKAHTSFQAFAAAYRDAAETATQESLLVGAVGGRSGDAIPVHLTIRTRVFGTVNGVLELPVSGSGDALRIAWRPSAVFRGFSRASGSRATRRSHRAPRCSRATEPCSPKAPTATRRTRSSPRRSPAASDRRRPTRPRRCARSATRTTRRSGSPGSSASSSTSSRGRPAARCWRGDRVLARSATRPGQPVRTTIDRRLERAAVAALAGRYGGVAAMDPRTGEVLALAGVAFSALQPPGSTFKIVTLTGVLESHLASEQTTFPVEDAAFLSGVRLENANGEYCGGTLIDAFATSCNSVFAPLGARLGAKRLVDVAQRFGFNAPTDIPGAQESTIPAADTIGDDLAVGSSAIGQGLVQATTLQMTTVAATIADGGRRPIPTLQVGARPRFVRVTRPAVAREVARMMRAVVAYGTGTAAAIPGAHVAGKTGTAELASTVPPDTGGDQQQQQQDQQPAPRIPRTDAWFVAFAPWRAPRIAVGLLFPEAGAGGDVAAPAARGVLAAALQHGAGE